MYTFKVISQIFHCSDDKINAGINFQLFHHGLIFEILKKLTAELGEKSVECVLLTLKSIGFALRKDDPIALKDLIATLQTKTNEASDDLKNKYTSTASILLLLTNWFFLLRFKIARV